MGAAGKVWCEPVSFVLAWDSHGQGVKILNEQLYGSFSRCIQNQHLYFQRGVAFTTIGGDFSGRSFRVPSIFDTTGCSVFNSPVAETLCLFNSRDARYVLESLNPTIHFTNGDVNRLPLFPIDLAVETVAILDSEFTVHESHREPSVEFKSPGPSPWRHVQEWAQLAVDRPKGDPLPPYIEYLDPEPATDHLSFAVGAVLGRFGGDGEGVLDSAKTDLSATLPFGICFLDGTLEKGAGGDSLSHGAAKLLHTTWTEYGPAIDPEIDLRTWLRLKFFGDVHKSMYENRPIYFPLSSGRKTFVAYVSIHRWTEATLRDLLADRLHPARTRLEGEISDLSEPCQSADKKIASEAENRYTQVTKWKQELDDFITKVEQCAEKGPPPSDAKTPEREVDARYAPDLDDGVMINSAALWPLLEPQWKDPKKWWKELASAKGKKDYDWSHLAARYFPSRVDEKCKDAPSLAVAHGCFWKYHPAIAYKWELRLQDEIGPDFTIDEEGSNDFRAAFEREHPDEVEELVAAEAKRRERKRNKTEDDSDSMGPLFDLAEGAAD
jgi:hypothetical protein